MKTPIFALILLLVAANCLHAAEPAQFKTMQAGCCYAGNKKDDPKALGGYGSSNNLPKRLSGKEKVKKEDVYIEIAEGREVLYEKKYEGILLRLVNGEAKTAAIDASDSRIAIVQEAQTKDGTWQEIEYLPSSWCGNSFHNVYLEPRQYWEFTVPKYSGPLKTNIRFKLVLSPTRTIYSSTYRGGIFPQQFKKPVLKEY